MLEPSCETGADCDKAPVAALPRPHGYFQPVPRKNTVKELLLIKRQKHNRFLDEDTASHTLDLFSTRAPASCQTAPPAPMSLFQWQVQQEEQRVAGTSAEQLSQQDADGDTVLHIAVAQGKRALAYVLASKMASCGMLDLKEHNGQTALQIAAATNNHLMVRDLLSHGANVNTHDLWGRSPLHICAQKGYVRSLQAIWKTLRQTRQQLDIEMYNYDGSTALYTASVSHNGVVRELRRLRNFCPHRNTELETRRQTYTATVRMLLLMGASVGTKDLKSGRTCLHVASEEANVELLLLFLNSPSSVAAINATTFNGNTALHVVGALQNSRSQAAAAKLLLTRGADPGLRNLENELPWQLVPAGPGREEVRQLLKGKPFQR